MAGQTVSPMMQQYFEIKKQHPNEILFYRVGDFYEMFYDDALTASRELELTLTGKACGGEERAPMCGVPFHSYEIYVARLIAKGYKVAICEQMEDPALAKGLVRRDIIRVVTLRHRHRIEHARRGQEQLPLFDLRQTHAQPLEKAGVCFADISTGEAYGDRAGRRQDGRRADCRAVPLRPQRNSDQPGRSRPQGPDQLHQAAYERPRRTAGGRLLQARRH